MSTKEVREFLSRFKFTFGTVNTFKGYIISEEDMESLLARLENSASGKARSIHVNEQTNKCDSCNGSGYINEDTFQESECDSCAGSGIIT